MRILLFLGSYFYLQVNALAYHSDVDPCDSDPCQNGATCMSDGDGFQCTCPPGFTGPECNTPGDTLYIQSL